MGVAARVVAAAGLHRPAAAIERLQRPLASAPFRRLVEGKLVSQFGDWLLLAALVGWVYQATRSTAAVALLMLLRLLPPIIGGGLAASFVDRLRKDRLLVRIELARGLAVGCALTGIVLGLRPLVFSAVALIGVLAPVSSVSVRALVPSLVAEQQLPAANAGLGVAQELAMALGALSAGIMLSAGSSALALACALASAVGAAFLYRGVGEVPPRPPPAGREEQGLLGGIRYLRRSPRLLVLVASFATATLATGLTNASLPRFLEGQLGLGPGGYGFGIAALAGGLALGGALVGLVRVERITAGWVGFALLAMGALFSGLAFTGNPLSALLLLGLIGIADGTSEVVFDTVVQRETDARYLGRVLGLAQASMTTTMMAAVAAAPLVNGVASPRVTILCSSLWLLGGGALGLTWNPRGSGALRPIPSSES